MRALGFLWLAVVALGLSGCWGAEQEELQRWMLAQRAQVKASESPITAPAPLPPPSYTGAAAADPFSVHKLSQALRRDAAPSSSSGLIALELARRKEELESYALDSMAMVGRLSRHGQSVALIRVDQQLYPVRIGNHLGLHYGRVTHITETELGLREIVPDAAGEWIERTAVLPLQERAK